MSTHADAIILPNGRKPELLAPAGGWEQLEYAIRFGADAVYLAAEKFGMRQRADNFKLSDMPRVAQYAHEHGAKVHVTCNIVMHDDDIAQLPPYLEAMQASGIDALIIGDLGAWQLARKYAPEVQLHVSTQASVSNARSALAWYEMGASRIVCAREMSLKSIANMREKLPKELELEAFVHGAVCMAYSGRCLISDFLANRSGIGGHCTQSCRWNYALVEQKRPGEYIPIEEDGHGSYIMNAKDMNMLTHLRDLAAAGIDSFKIEGRNKKAFYVATAVNAYRQVLDGIDPALMVHELDTVSHRPYGTGFYYGPATQNPDTDTYVRNCNWVAQVLECEVVSDGESPRLLSNTSANANIDAADSSASRPLYRALVQERNRFSINDDLEIMSPHMPVTKLHIERLQHLPERTTDDFKAGVPYDVQLAKRGMEKYIIYTYNRPLKYDIIRAWQPATSSSEKHSSIQ